MEVQPADLEKVAGAGLAQAILQVRVEDIHVEPGYDGVFGKIFLSHSDSISPVESGDNQPPLSGL
jgi:hypothetical protein